MGIKRVNFLFILFFVFYTKMILSDIAPFVCRGFSFTPVENNEIKMKKETVNIYYSRVCKVVAKFHMENKTGNKIRMKVGFPITHFIIEGINRGNKELFFRAKSNGKQISNLKVWGNVDLEGKVCFKNFSYSWYVWDQSFLPGETIIDVEYTIYPSASKFNPFRNIYYVLSTGARWKDRIDYAKLTIHFPRPIHESQIIPSTKPVGYTISNKTLTWTFSDFLPTEKDDLCLTLLPFYIFEKITDFKRKIEKNRVDEDLKLDFAIYLLSKFNYRGYGRFIPIYHVNESHLINEILDKLKSKNDKDYVKSLYYKKDNGYYYIKESRKSEKEKLRPILYSIDYTPSHVFPRYARESENLISEVLKTNPQNSKAWNIYLSYYYKMYFSAFGPSYWGGINVIRENQKELIREAYKHCPEDKGIRLWMEMIDDNMKQIPKDLGRLEFNPSSGFKISIPSIPGGQLIQLSRKRVECLFELYGISSFHLTRFKIGKNTGTGWVTSLILKEGEVDRDKKRELFKFLNELKYFQRYYGQKLYDLNMKNGIYKKVKNEFILSRLKI